MTFCANVHTLRHLRRLWLIDPLTTITKLDDKKLEELTKVQPYLLRSSSLRFVEFAFWSAQKTIRLSWNEEKQVWDAQTLGGSQGSTMQSDA